MASQARLLAIVAVAAEHRVQCQDPGCGQGVFAAIHVVEDNGKIIVLGSTCFARRYGGSHALGQASYSSGGGGVLSDDERQMLQNNTAELVALFKDRAERALRASADKLRSTRVEFARRSEPQRPAPLPARGRSPAPDPAPWGWQHQRNKSVALFRSASGQHWVRVQHQDGTHKITPWPMFDGWDEALPSSCGTPDLVLQAYSPADLVGAFATLRRLGHVGPIVGVWPKVLQETQAPGVHGKDRVALAIKTSIVANQTTKKMPETIDVLEPPT